MNERVAELLRLVFLRYMLAANGQCATCHMDSEMTSTIETQPMEVAG